MERNKQKKPSPWSHHFVISQELCRQRMAFRASERVERPETLRHSRLNSVSSQFSDGPIGSPSARSSTSSWCEEPVPANMDISTGHMILVRILQKGSEEGFVSWSTFGWNKKRWTVAAGCFVSQEFTWRSCCKFSFEIKDSQLSVATICTFQRKYGLWSWK